MALTKIGKEGITGIDNSSDATAITISSGEVVTLADDLIIKDSGTIGSASKTDAITIASSGLVQLTSTGIGAGSQVFQVIDDGATLFQIRAEDGNVSFPQSGAGIYLGVTSGTASNLLDDYEEGTFTPGLIDSGGGLGANLTTAVGQYTKIGNKVHFQMRINGDARTSTSNQVYITNLPFTCSPASSVNRAQFEVNGINLGLDSGFYSLIGQLANTDTSITILMQGTSLDNFRGHDLTPSYEIYVHGSYFTS